MEEHQTKNNYQELKILRKLKVKSLYKDLEDISLNKIISQV